MAPALSGATEIAVLASHESSRSIRLRRRLSSLPGLGRSSRFLFPPLKRWAIVGCPYGTKTRKPPGGRSPGKPCPEGVPHRTGSRVSGVQPLQGWGWRGLADPGCAPASRPWAIVFNPFGVQRLCGPLTSAQRSPLFEGESTVYRPARRSGHRDQFAELEESRWGLDTRASLWLGRRLWNRFFRRACHHHFELQQ